MFDFLPHTSPVELWQFSLAGLGLLLGFWRLWVAIENGLLLAKLDGKDLRKVVAETQIIGEMFRLFAFIVLMCIGVISVLLPPPIFHGTQFYDLEDVEGALQPILTRFGLITLTALMVVDSFVQELRRRQFLARVANAVEIAEERKEDKVIASISEGVEVPGEK